MFTDTNSGAEAAFKGFRTQTLYILERILSSNSQDIFYPESVKDLLIKSGSGEIKEVIQIKNYSSHLALSNLEPEKEDSFFKRCLTAFYKENLNPNILLVSFGELGRELSTLKSEKKSSSIREKLLAKNYSVAEVQWIFNQLSITEVDETKLTDIAIEHLSDVITGFSPEIAFDLLMFWLYKISENKGYVDKDSLIGKLKNIGLFFSRRKSFLIEFGTTIQPFERNNTNKELLADEFYQGVSTKYEHIIGGFDVIRKPKIIELQSLFQESNVVVVQGASGQGKSTLAYRYLYSHFPNNLSFWIHQSFSTSQIPSILAALKVLVEPYDLPVCILIDVPPNETEKWTQLIKSLIEVENLKLLVTIRAEDYNRSENIGEFTKVGDLLLNFSKTEAQDIYDSISKIKVDFKFTSFDEAWINFGESGSLLEFVYLITQGESLEIRLRNQIRKIEKRWNENVLYLLKVIAVAHGYGCEINTANLRKVSTSSKLRVFVEELENEYFLRTSSEGKLLLGLHPIRSQIISELLIDDSFDDLEQIACDALKVISENDVSKLLLNSFHDSGESFRLLQELKTYKIAAWKTAEGILRALFWLGIKKFSALNNDLIIEFRKEFYTTLFLMIDDMGVDFSGLGEKNEKVAEMLRLSRQLKQKEDVYQFGKDWLMHFQVPSPSEMSDEDWSGLAYTLYWADRFEIRKEVAFSDLPPFEELSRISINTYADVLLVLYSYSAESKKLYDKFLPDFIYRIKNEYNVVFLEEGDETIDARFIYDLVSDTEEYNQTSVHQLSINIINLLRKAIPNKETYATQGFGHKVNFIPYPHDDSIKRIPIKNLPISWRTEINSVFHQYIKHQNRSIDWKDYTTEVIEVRKRNVEMLASLTKILEQYFKKKDFALLEPFFTNYKSEWYRVELPKADQLPKIAFLDKWGYSKEHREKNDGNLLDNFVNVIPASNSQFLMDFGEYLEVTRDFFSYLTNFYSQIDKIYVYNFFTYNKKGKELKKITAKLEEQGWNPNWYRLSIINLFDAYRKLSEFQILFNKHFSKFYPRDLLESLIEEENDCYLKVAVAWKKFTQIRSGVSKSQTKKILNSSPSGLKSAIENKLDNNLSFLCDSKKIETYDIVEYQEGEASRVAILFDVNTPIDIYSKFAFVLKAISKSLYPADYTTIKRLIIDHYFSPLTIVPLVYNRVTMPIYYQVPSFIFLDSDKEITFDSISIYSKKFTNRLAQKLGVGTWDAEITSLTGAQRFLSNNVSMALYLNHVSQVEELAQKLEDDEAQGLELVKEHIKKKLEIVVDLLIHSMNDCSLIQSCISLTSEEMSVNDEKKEFAEILLEYQNYLIEFAKLFNLDQPESEEGGIISTITSQDIVKWNTIFQEEMQITPLFVYLYWVNELIKPHTDKLE